MTPHLLPKVKVLVVHGDPALQFYYRHVFKDLGLEAVPATTYAAGLSYLDQGTFGFVVVSQGSDAFEGRCILVRAMEKDRHIPVLVVTRCRHMGSYIEAIQLGAADYLEEPITMVEIGRVVTSRLCATSSAN